MKRNLIIIVLIFIGILVLMLMGNVITIGDKLYDLTHNRWVELGFYCLVALGLFYLIIWPIVRLHSTPEFPHLSVDAYVGETDQTKRELKRFAVSLSKHLGYLPKEEREAHRKELRQQIDSFYDISELRTIVQKELDLRFDTVKSHINEWAKTVFMLTAVSQNGKLDAAISMVINFRMIFDLIRCSGYRPSHGQLFKQYVRILVTSLFSYYLSNTLEDFDLTTLGGEEAADTVITGNTVSEPEFLTSVAGLKFLNMVPASLVDGALNSLLTLRIGYVTLSYLKEGTEGLAGRRGMKVRRNAMLQAIKAFGIMAKDTTISGLALIGEKIGDLLKKGQDPEPETAASRRESI